MQLIQLDDTGRFIEALGSYIYCYNADVDIDMFDYVLRLVHDLVEIDQEGARELLYHRTAKESAPQVQEPIFLQETFKSIDVPEVLESKEGRQSDLSEDQAGYLKDIHAYLASLGLSNQPAVSLHIALGTVVELTKLEGRLDSPLCTKDQDENIAIVPSFVVDNDQLLIWQ